MIAERLLKWYDREKRTLPFRGTRDPYRVWLSEIMLQQTRTETVSSYYMRFLERFPDVRALADADERDVLKAWEGLGYYTRARNLHAAAKMVASEYGGQFPRDEQSLRALPGVGAYTAAAVASIAYDLPCPAVDGNLTRVLARVFGVREDVGAPSVRRSIVALAQREMPCERCGEFNQALMDLGATICKPGTPDCDKCPLSDLCDARREDDADRLPIMERKKQPTPIDLSVTIATRHGRVLLQKRKEQLLGGLYVFLLDEGAPRLPNAEYIKDARHVFTHRVWNMRLYHAEVSDDFKTDGVWATRRDMLSLPLPTAMRTAKEAAVRLLTPTFEPLTNKNIARTADAYAQSWREAHRSMCSASFLKRHDAAYFADALEKHARQGRAARAICLNGWVVGALVYDESIGEINSLYIAPMYQGAGLGRDAVRYALDAMGAHEKITVTVLEHNAAARALYASFGFAPTGERNVLDATRGVAEIVMARERKVT